MSGTDGWTLATHPARDGLRFTARAHADPFRVAALQELPWIVLLARRDG